MGFFSLDLLSLDILGAPEKMVDMLQDHHQHSVDHQANAQVRIFLGLESCWRKDKNSKGERRQMSEFLFSQALLKDIEVGLTSGGTKRPLMMSPSGPVRLGRTLGTGG